MTRRDVSRCFRPSYGWPDVFSPEGCGPAIEDVWPSLHIGADRVEEMKRKVSLLAWAREALSVWRTEAEAVLLEEPRFIPGEPGGRCGLYISDRGHRLIFDPFQSERVYDPISKEWLAPSDDNLKASVVLSHERIRRLMSSLGFLYRLTGDERYSRWVWEGLRQSVALYRNVHLPGYGQEKDPHYSAIYGGLYEAQSMLQLVQALELVQNAPGGSATDAQALDKDVFELVGNVLSRWMDVMIVHNMSCWAMAALAHLGRRLGRRDWVDKALHSERCGLRMLLERGLPLDPKTGKPNGFWHETSTFYNFYALLPLIPLYRVGEEEGVLDDGLRERFRSFFDAPLHLVDSDLRLVPLGDRIGPGLMSLTQFRHAYEYAAGQVDEARYGPVLSMLYARCGAPRTSLAALAWGPDELPPPCPPPSRSVVLGASRMAAFRKQTPRGPVTMWFLGGEENHPGQGHHHHDKLSVSLYAFGEIISSDLGLPAFDNNVWSHFLRGSFGHNTLSVNEVDQGPMESLLFEADVDANVPWARAVVRGNRDGHRASLWKTMVNRGDRVREGVCDDVVLDRTVLFDPPYFVLIDRCEAPAERRFAFVFHGSGRMVAQTAAAEDAPALGLPAIGNDGPLAFLEARDTTDPAAAITADWRVRDGVWLRLVSISDGPFEATVCRTPGNPRDEVRGTVLLRAPGVKRRFVTALELHAGSPTLRAVRCDLPATAELVLFDGAVRPYVLSHIPGP
jgi:hypothetical protein